MYLAIKYIHETENIAVEKLCAFVHLNRSSYYKWLKRKPSNSEVENSQVVEWINQLYEEQNGIFGYRQMTITINREFYANAPNEKWLTELDLYDRRIVAYKIGESNNNKLVFDTFD